MSDYLNLFIQLILIITLGIIALLLTRMSNSLKKEKRITKFAIDAISDKPISFFDKIETIYAHLISKTSKFLKKIKIFDTYSEKYEIYVDQTKRIRKDAMDFISHKILIGVIALIITIISDVLRLQVISIFQLLLALLVGFFIPDIFLHFANKKRAKQIEEDLLKAVIIMNNAFKSGRSIMQAVELVAKELTGPISDEFKKMFIDLTYGLELELVFERFSKRVKLDEVKYMSSSLIILNKTGGNIVKVFSSIEKGFFDRKKLKDELHSVTALSNFVFKILIAVPLVIFIIIYALNPSYFVPLYTTVLGKVILVLVLAIYLLYIVIVQKVTKMKEW